MNREILFKARRGEWRTLPEEKQWVEGDLLYSKEGTYISTSFITGGREIPMVVAISYLVEPETVFQYIGRIDTEGKKVFENDMVQKIKMLFQSILDYSMLIALKYKVQRSQT